MLRWLYNVHEIGGKRSAFRRAGQRVVLCLAVTTFYLYHYVIGSAPFDLLGSDQLCTRVTLGYYKNMDTRFVRSVFDVFVNVVNNCTPGQADGYQAFSFIYSPVDLYLYILYIYCIWKSTAKLYDYALVDWLDWIDWFDWMNESIICMYAQNYIFCGWKFHPPHLNISWLHILRDIALESQYLIIAV